MRKLRNVAVTGMGAITPLGENVEETWAGLLESKSGIKHIGEDWEKDYPIRVAGAVTSDIASEIDKIKMRRLDRCSQLALIAAREAWNDAKHTNIDADRLCVTFGTGIGGMQTVLDQIAALAERGYSRVNPMTVPMIMPNAPAATIGLEFGAKGGVHAPVSACATGAEAIGMGYRMIANNEADIVIAGGTEAIINKFCVSAFSIMRALSLEKKHPEKASRPYDVDRNGFVIAEGAGALILESEDLAKERSASIYGYITGLGMSSDAHHIAAPDPDGAGAAKAMQKALSNADLSPKDINHVNAHATSTPLGDLAESKAIKATFAKHTANIPVYAPKSNLGHLIGGAGAVESIITMLTLQNRTIPPTLNLDNKDPEIDLDIVTNETRAITEKNPVALNNSFGFGGHNIALVFASHT